MKKNSKPEAIDSFGDTDSFPALEERRVEPPRLPPQIITVGCPVRMLPTVKLDRTKATPLYKKVVIAFFIIMAFGAAALAIFAR